MKLVFNDHHLTINLDEENQILHLKWYGSITGEQFKLLAGEIIRQVGQSGVSAILSDNTAWEIISPNDHGWAASHWFPQAEKAGITKIASVLSRNVFHVAAERNIQQLTDLKRLEIRHFREIHMAESWLIAGAGTGIA
jgi:hypothetical protein